MRFTSKLVEPTSIDIFSRLVSTVTKLSKTSILRLSPSPKLLAFVQVDELNDKAHRLWCSVDPNELFDDFRVEGLNLTDANEILLELKTDDLNRAIKAAPAQGASQIRIRLTRKDSTPYLAVEILLPSLAEGSRNVVHFVPVNITPQRYWHDYKQPELPRAHASVFLPPVRSLQRVVAGMKNIDHHVLISVNRNGCLTLSVETETVTLRSHFTGLEIPNVDQVPHASQDENEQPDRFYYARVPLKTLVHFLSTQNVPVAPLVCNIVHKRVAHFYCANEDVSFQYYIPSVLS